MVIKTFYINLILLTIFSVGSAQAQVSKLNTENLVSLDSTHKVLVEARKQITSYEQKLKSQLDSNTQYLNDYENNLKQDNNNKSKVAEEIDIELKAKLIELYSTKTQLDIYPEIVKMSSNLAGMADYYREQAGMYTGEETLSSGVYGEHFQKRRNALSKMISQIGLEVTNLKDITVARKNLIQEISSDIKDAVNNPNSRSTRIGFDHFLNLKIALLDNQELILNDISVLNSGVDLNNRSGSLNNLCNPDEDPLFTNLIDQNNILLSYTIPWSTTLNDLPDYSVSKWKNTRESQLAGAKSSPKEIQDLFSGFKDDKNIYWPGIISDWKSCRGTKYNILVDLKNKIELEIRRGRLDVAMEFELAANQLEIEINRTDGQIKRLEQIKDIFQGTSEAAEANAFKDQDNRYTYPDWKKAVYSQARNLARLENSRKSILFALKKLIAAAQAELFSLATLDSDEPDFKIKASIVTSRLDALITSGFEILEAELISASGSLDVMSKNIASAEGSSGQGGLGEAILKYEFIVDLRNQQISDDARDYLPNEYKAIQFEVLDLENYKSKVLNEINTNNQKLSNIGTLKTDLANQISLYNRFFSLRSPHPLYSSIGKEFIRSIKLSKKSNSDVNREFLKMIKSFKLTDSSGRNSASGYCSGKLAASCKSASRSSSGKRISKAYKTYLKQLKNTIEDESANIIVDSSLSELDSLISGFSAKVSI